MSDAAYILGTLSDEDVEWLADHGVRRTLAPGERVIVHGTATTAVFLVLEGTLEYAPGGDPGSRSTTLAPGDVVGEGGLLHGGRAAATVTATSRASVLELPHAVLTSKLRLDVGFAARFYRALAVLAACRCDGGAGLEATGGDSSPAPEERPDVERAGDRMRRFLRRLERPDIVTVTGADLSVEDVARVAWQHAPVAASATARERMARSRAVVDRFAALDTPVYGVTTNLGELKDARVADSDEATFQRHILLSHAAGVAPEHPPDVVRAIMLARLNGMARGGAGVHPEVFDALATMLNAGVHPVVPSRGSIGMSDLVPLAHLALPLVGEGEVEYEGRRMPGADGLAAAGIEAPQLGAKDGLALVSANSASVGQGALVIARCQDLLAIADVVAALSLEALGGHLTVLDRQVESAHRFSGQLVSAQRMRSLLANSSLWTSPPTLGVQDPISFRCATQVHGAVLDVHATVRDTLETELNSSGDNPIVLIDRGEIVSNGNFHPAGLSIAFDTLAIALAQLTSMASNRIVRLMDPAFTHLSAYLSARPGLNVGLGVLQKTATALNAEVRLGANPASLDYVPVAGSIEDHATMATESVAKSERAVDAALGILAIELLVAAQAIDLREDITLGAGTGAAFRTVRERVPAMREDRFVAGDVQVVRELLDDGSVLRVAGEAISTRLGARVQPSAAARVPG